MAARLRPVPAAAHARPPWWAVRLEELSERELELLAHVTGGHIPFEVRFNLERLETERSQLQAHARDGG